MKNYLAFSKKVAAAVLHANDYAQLETLANRAAFERSLVKDLISEDVHWERVNTQYQEAQILFNMEDVRLRLSSHEQLMLENFRQLYDHSIMGYLLNDQDL